MMDTNDSKRYSLRNELISRAQQGEITPEIAEAEAEANGLRAFANKPEVSKFNPMNESSWSLTMALAWIAWRDVELVRMHWNAYRTECRGWVFRKWRQPVAEGTQFALRKGWFVETEPATNVNLLKLCDDEMRLHSRLPVTTKRTISDALDALKDFLDEGALIAEAIDVATGKDTEIPNRSWSFLTLQQEQDQDVLRGTSSKIGFRDLKFLRRDLLRLWPSRQFPAASDLGPITPEMFRAICTPGDDGHVPFDATICWISTNGGSLAVELADEAAWERAVSLLLPKIASGKIEIIGRSFGTGSNKPIDRLKFVGIKVINPLHEANDSADALLSADPHIVCSFFGDDWGKAGGDKFYQQFVPEPEWTHLQGKKSDILREFVFPKVDPIPDFRAVTDTLEPSRKKLRRPGRKKGQGSFEKLDRPLISKMETIIEAGAAASPEEAARKVAEEAHGSGTIESKAERLAKRFRAIHAA